jgi:hypothetical protein
MTRLGVDRRCQQDIITLSSQILICGKLNLIDTKHPLIVYKSEVECLRDLLSELVKVKRQTITTYTAEELILRTPLTEQTAMQCFTKSLILSGKVVPQMMVGCFHCING